MACRTSWLASRPRKISNDGATVRPAASRTTAKTRATTVKRMFGPVAVPNPRWRRCVCQNEGPMTFRPTAAWLQGRTSPELLYLETKWASLIPFAKVADLLQEVLPVGETTNHETVREHLQAVAERIEDELAP